MVLNTAKGHNKTVQSLQWLGYAKKQNAKDKLIRNFDDGLNFGITQMRETKQDGTFSQSIYQ